MVADETGRSYARGLRRDASALASTEPAPARQVQVPAPQAPPQVSRDGRATNRRRLPRLHHFARPSASRHPPPRRPPREAARANDRASPASRFPSPSRLSSPKRDRACKRGSPGASMKRRLRRQAAGYKLRQHPPRSRCRQRHSAGRISRQRRLRAFESDQEDQGGERPLDRRDLRPQHRRIEACSVPSRRRASPRERGPLRHPIRREDQFGNRQMVLARRQAPEW